MFLKVSQSYHIVVTLASLRPSQMEAKGVVVLQRGVGDGASRKAVAPLRRSNTKALGDEQKSS